MLFGHQWVSVLGPLVFLFLRPWRVPTFIYFLSILNLYCRYLEYHEKSSSRENVVGLCGVDSSTWGDKKWMCAGYTVILHSSLDTEDALLRTRCCWPSPICALTATQQAKSNTRTIQMFYMDIQTVQTCEKNIQSVSNTERFHIDLTQIYILWVHYKRKLPSVPWYKNIIFKFECLLHKKFTCTCKKKLIKMTESDPEI